MLVLARRINEALKIGDDIVITVCEIDGRTVRLGIEAPRHVPIYRAELTPFVAGRIEQRAEANDPKTEGGAK